MNVLSIVVVSHNTADLLRRCLASLACCEPEAEVIVVDNASTDGSAAMVRADFPEVILVANRHNVGFAAATNQGLAKATGHYIAMLNSDTELLANRPRSISTLAGYLETHPDVGVVAPGLRNPDGSVQRSASWSAPNMLNLFFEYTLLNRALYHLFPGTRYPGKLLLSREELRHKQSVADLLGACVVFRQRLLQEIGTFDERFFLFLEETDFHSRVRAAGYQIHYLPEVQVIHLWGGTIDTGTSQWPRYRLYYPSLYKYLRKHHGASYTAAAYALAVSASTLSLLVLVVAFVPATVLGWFGWREPGRRLLHQWQVILGVLRWHLGIGR